MSPVTHFLTGWVFASCARLERRDRAIVTFACVVPDVDGLGIIFHIHLIEDLVGSRGPDGDQWPIPYLKPFSSNMQLVWHGQWSLNGWQNYVITLSLAGITFWIAAKKGISPVEIFSPTADERVVSVIRSARVFEASLSLGPVQISASPKENFRRLHNSF